MGAVYATVDDVKVAALRDLNAEEVLALPGLLEQASAKLRMRVPGIDEALAADGDKVIIARAAVVNAVKRVFRNPDGASTISETAGVFSRSLSYQGQEADGGVEFTDADLSGLVAAPTSQLPMTARVKSGYRYR